MDNPMTLTEVLPALYALMAFMIVASLVAIETSDLLSGVICVGAAGFGLCIIDLLLGAPDLAITQVAVEIVCLVLLIRVVITRQDETHERPKDTLALGSVVLGLGVLLALSFVALRSMRPFGDPVMHTAGPYMETALEATGATNFVTAVLLDYRAYDTLGEATVIFSAIIGALVVLRTIGRLRDEGHELNR